MECQGCCLKKNRDIFEKMTHVFESRHYLALFLLNTILNIQEDWSKFCKCKTFEICLVCQTKRFYNNYQYYIYKHSLNLIFLAKLRENLYRNLLKLLTLDNHFACNVVNKKHRYFHVDWFTGEKIDYNLDVCLTYFEQKKIHEIRYNNCKVVLKSI